jgi:hypothetical protein
MWLSISKEMLVPQAFSHFAHRTIDTQSMSVRPIDAG